MRNTVTESIYTIAPSKPLRLHRNRRKQWSNARTVLARQSEPDRPRRREAKALLLLRRRWRGAKGA